MLNAPVPYNEQERIEALRALGLLDTAREDRFDRISRIAKRIFQVPIVTITLVDSNRQWFKSCLGLEIQGTPRDVSFCTHAILSHQTLVVEDALTDARFSDNPLVTHEPFIRFYAGHPLRAASGHNVGSFCLIDRVPRRMTPEELECLHDLARLVEEELNNLELGVALASLRKSESDLQGIMNAVAEGILTIGADGRIETFNGAAEGMFACPAHRQLGARFGSLLANPIPEELEDILSHQTGEQGWEGQALRLEVLAARFDGTSFPSELSITKLQNESGRARYVAVFRDVSDRLRLEKETLARRAAEAASELKGQFLSKVSHETRTPLNAILGLTHMLLGSELNGRQRDYLEKLQSAAGALLRMIDDCLDFSQLDSGKLELKLTDLSLDELLDAVVPVIAAEARDKGLDLQVRLGEGVPHRFIGDSARLGQILANLLGNAVKFTDSGEVRLTVALEQSDEATVTLRFTVTDTGVGLKPGQLYGLFSAFSQGDNSITRKHGGAGLGLALCQELVRLMDGRISVDSQAGVGSSFAFSARFGASSSQTALALPTTARSHPIAIAPSRAEDGSFLEDALRQLAGLLAQSDGGAVSAVEELLEQAAPGRFEPLAVLVRRFDFEAALRELEQLGFTP